MRTSPPSSISGPTEVFVPKKRNVAKLIVLVLVVSAALIGTLAYMREERKPRELVLSGKRAGGAAGARARGGEGAKPADAVLGEAGGGGDGHRGAPRGRPPPPLPGGGG